MILLMKNEFCSELMLKKILNKLYYITVYQYQKYILNKISKKTVFMKTSSWKSPYQFKKRERSQLSWRKDLGMLEKKRDYKIRSQIYHKKEKELNQLKKEAELRNPNEFYFSMISDMKEKPLETKFQPLSHFTKEQKLLLKTRNKEYIDNKITQHKRKLEKLRSELPRDSRQASKIYYNSVDEYINDKDNIKMRNEEIEETMSSPEVQVLMERIKHYESVVAKLEEVYNEMRIQEEMKKNPEYTQVEDDDGNISYVWKTRRSK